MRAEERGATVVSVLLLVLALSTLGLLSLRSSGRELRAAGAQVARERARVAASAGIALAWVRLESLGPGQLDAVLAGSRPQGPSCGDPCRDCIPVGAELLADDPPAAGTCLAPPCSRPGAVARLPDRDDARAHWCELPLRQLVDGGDADARLSVWIRNDTADALDGGGWRHDEDGRVVITAVAEVHGTRVIQRETVVLRRD
ncbi:MAG: hypothetical protein KC501_05600 [Myxococcales bacterium]|nr:hypothetical protein [Myxococcales bacterium]